MRRRLLAAVFLLAGAAALRVGIAGRATVLAPERPETIRPTGSWPTLEAAAPVPAGEGDPLARWRGNAACDRIAEMERFVRRYHTSLNNPSDEWIRLVHLIRILAVELWEAPRPLRSDAELAFEPEAFARIQAAAQELARVAEEYYEAARTRQASLMATLRPAFEEAWASFTGLVRRNLRR